MTKLRIAFYNATHWPLPPMRWSQEEVIQHQRCDTVRMLVHYALGPVLWPLQRLLMPKDTTGGHHGTQDP